MDKELLQKYADFTIQVGVNLQKGQTLLLRAPLEGAEFARLCAKAAYDAGAKDVVMMYADEQFNRLRMQRAGAQVLEDIKPWQLARYMDYVNGEGSASVLSILAEDPEIYKGIDTEKLSRARNATSKAMKPFNDLTMANKLQWCVVAIPSRAWASRIFPGLAGPQAEEKLWQVIFEVCRVQGGNPVGAWKQHIADMEKHRNWLNAQNLQSIHLTSANGTNLTVGLADGHIWAGALEDSQAGVPFLANIPTEEVFTAPHRLATEGVVKSSMPYVYNGNLIEGITVRFEKGKAVEYSAEKGNDLLHQMLGVDEGAKHLGEIALVPATSPIRQSGLLFFNTLFDENAACHMAFGAGYPTTVQGGGAMGRQQLTDAGVNDSLIHEDIMIGTEDMEITGLTKEGETVQVFKNGVWAAGAQ